MMNELLGIGKLPVEILSNLLDQIPISDPSIILGPGIGLDCSVIDVGSTLLVLKTDPITFTSENIGWYAVNINANDIATTAALPRWMLAVLLLPGSSATTDLVEKILHQILHACEEIGVTLVGGHTEITHGIDHPLLIGTMIGEVTKDKLITPQGALPEDRLLLTKGVPIEAVSILAQEFESKLSDVIDKESIAQAKEYIYHPGISVLRDAQIALKAGDIHAMHDPTEGGLLAALWELSDASGESLLIDIESVPVSDLAHKICRTLGIDPLAAIASGALLLAAHPNDANRIQKALHAASIPCEDIGKIAGNFETETGMHRGVYTQTDNGLKKLPRPIRDDITRLF